MIFCHEQCCRKSLSANVELQKKHNCLTLNKKEAKSAASPSVERVVLVIDQSGQVQVAIIRQWPVAVM